jgi:hypothetical protein
MDEIFIRSFEDELSKLAVLPALIPLAAKAGMALKTALPAAKAMAGQMGAGIAMEKAQGVFRKQPQQPQAFNRPY